jgi:Type II secretion system (T2SS), protein E, N-terminal domain
MTRESDDAETIPEVARLIAETMTNPLTTPIEEPSAALPVARPADAGRPRLGELLVQKGYINRDQLTWALQEAYVAHELLGVILLRKKLIFEQELARTLSEQLAVPYINIHGVGVDRVVARLLPAEIGKAAIAIPVRMQSDNIVQVAFGDPTDLRALTAVEECLPRFSIAVAEVSAITDEWQKIERLTHPRP